jgi:hypothetical protein
VGDASCYGLFVKCGNGTIGEFVIESLVTGDPNNADGMVCALAHMRWRHFLPPGLASLSKFPGPSRGGPYGSAQSSATVLVNRLAFSWVLQRALAVCLRMLVPCA